MERIKKLHETIEIFETLRRDCLNCLKSLMQISLRQLASDRIRQRSLNVPPVRDKLLIS